MWVPTEQEAVYMFARHFEARHRHGAVMKAKTIADRLNRTGDLEGSEIWNKVAARITELRLPELVARRRNVEAA